MQGVTVRLKGEVRICQQCGQPYEPKTQNQKYCSKHCGALHRGDQLEKVRKVCPICSKPFKASRHDKTYCSQVCQREAYRTGKGWGQTKIEWNNLREFILERDNFTCQDCDQFLMDMGLEAHHIKPLYRGGANSDKNLISLCHKCHKRRHSTGWHRTQENPF